MGNESDINWKGIGFALFGAAALVFAVGYAITKPGIQLIKEKDSKDVIKDSQSSDSEETVIEE